MTVPTLPVLPNQASTDWYPHYSAVDAMVRALASRTIVVDNIADLQGALDVAAGRPVRLTAATHTVTTPIVLPSNTFLTCDQGAVLKAANGLNSHVVMTSGVTSRVTIRGLMIDGNAVNQAEDVQGTGIYMVDVGALLIEDVTVYDCKGHGIHLSNDPAGAANQRINRCYVERSGSTNVSAYGSGIAVTYGTDLVITATKSRNNKRAGFRIDARGGVVLDGCLASGNGDGGILPVSGSNGLTVSDCRVSDNGDDGEGDGIRLLGTTDITIDGTTCKRNAGAGVGIYNSSARVTITGGQIQDNGTSADAVAALTGRSGVVIKHSGVAPVDVKITGVDFRDIQTTKTQDYAVEVRGSATGVDVVGNTFGPHAVGAVLDMSTAAGVTLDATNRGLTMQVRDFEDVTLTGDTTVTTLRQVVVKAGELGRSRGVRLRLSGTTTGTAGTKQVRFAVNGAGTLVMNQAAASPGAWTVEVDFWRRSGGSQRWIARLGNVSGHSTTYATTSIAHDTTDLTLAFTGQLGVATDTLVAAMWSVEPIL